MSVLTLVRHGQARAFQKESDLLTEAGEEQARRLASFWIENGIRFDEVYTGALVRQHATEQLVARSFAEAQIEWPAALMLPEFDEYDATGVLGRLVPALASSDPKYADLVRAFEAVRESPGERNRAFQKMFEVAMRVWLSGELNPDGVEPFTNFRDRVRRGLTNVMAAGGNRRVVVFTSGGPIGIAVQTAMHSPDRMFLEVNWRVRNCSVTEFLFSGDRFSLDSFNALPHLPDASLWTYR